MATADREAVVIPKATTEADVVAAAREWVWARNEACKGQMSLDVLDRLARAEGALQKITNDHARSEAWKDVDPNTRQMGM